MALETEHRGYKIRYSENADEWTSYDAGDGMTAPTLSKLKEKIDRMIAKQTCQGADEEAPPGSNPIISPDPILAAARMMLDNHNSLGSPGYNGALGLRALSAAIYAAEALRAADDYDAAPVALLRAFLTALIDPLHPDLDYLRADPKAAIEARASRHCDTCGRIQHAHNCGERDDG